MNTKLIDVIQGLLAISKEYGVEIRTEAYFLDGEFGIAFVCDELNCALPLPLQVIALAQEDEEFFKKGMARWKVMLDDIKKKLE